MLSLLQFPCKDSYNNDTKIYYDYIIDGNVITIAT